MDVECKQLYIDKYCPKCLDDYVLDESIKQYFKNMVKNNALQNFSVVGCQGSGKTTIAKIMANELNASVLFVKCATEGTIDILRSKVEPFCNALSFDGKQKIVILDELDAASGSLTGGSSFQSGLRTLIEAAQSDTKFIVTCNYVNKILPAVLSRCPVIQLKFSKKDLAVFIKKILDAESIKYDKESLKAFIESSFKYYPDCRRIVNYLQLCSGSGTLTVTLDVSDTSNDNQFMDELVQKIKTSSLLDVRKFYMANKDKMTDYLEFGSQLYKHVVFNGLVADYDAILKMTDLVYQLNIVIDRECTFFGLVTVIKRHLKDEA